MRRLGTWLLLSLASFSGFAEFSGNVAIEGIYTELDTLFLDGETEPVVEETKLSNKNAERNPTEDLPAIPSKQIDLSSEKPQVKQQPKPEPKHLHKQEPILKQQHKPEHKPLHKLKPLPKQLLILEHQHPHKQEHPHKLLQLP